MDTESHRTLRHRAAAALAFLAAGVAGPALGQTGSPEDMASARVLGTEGVRLADSGDCKGAVAKLQAAEKLYHAPTTLERLGECQVSLGQIVAGTESLNRVIREPLAQPAPQAFVAARERAQRALAAAIPRIAKLRVHVDGAPVDAVTVTVDGAGMPSALLDAGRPTDPGNHEVKVTAPGYLPGMASVVLRDGADVSVAVKLEVEPHAAPLPIAAPTGPAAPLPPAVGPGDLAVGSPTHASSDSQILPYSVLAVGGAGLAVGTVFGVLALSSKSSLDSACSNKVCPSSSQGDIDALGSRATVSTLAFGIGVGAVAVGTILLVSSGHGDQRANAPGTVRPWVGLGAAGVGGTFE
ncbi:MAG: hypothetical protein M3O50_15795 [Myxococcota bacterium]|nr:hypothetical protein [Myxococcota bacterium]